MHEIAPVHLANSLCAGDGETQERTRLIGGAEQPVEGLAAGIIEYQRCATGVLYECQRPQGPRAVQLILQFVFVNEAIEA